MYPTPSSTAFPQDLVSFPSVKGFPLARVLTVPNTTIQAKQLREQQQTVFDADNAKKDTFSNVSIDGKLDSRGYVYFTKRTTLSQSDAYKFILKNHYKTVITSANTWRDPATGRVHLFERKEPKPFVL